jgi:Group XII secretory phospholipase A2 precursor (PLA2G12)
MTSRTLAFGERLTALCRQGLQRLGPRLAADPADASTDWQAHVADSAFDNFTRSLGSQSSRRQVLKVSALGLVSTMAGSLLPRPAEAAADCLCGRALYDPLLQCCLAGGIVVNKHPVADLAACPSKVAHPGYTCVPNGCGAAGGTQYPGSYGQASFLGCCNNHDCCYGECNKAQAGCDTSFQGCLTSSCDAAYPPDMVTVGPLSFDRNRIARGACRTTAGAYYQAVNNFGASAHAAAQQAACDCCGTQPCPTCPGGTCSSLPSCQDPGCVCFQTTEGRGFCHLPQSCAGLSNCSSSANCPSGWACVSVTCCGSSPICIQPCFVVSGASAPMALGARSMGGMTTAGPSKSSGL